MTRKSDEPSRIELLQGTLGMLILRALQWGPQHGYGISQAIRTQSSEVLQVETGSLYPALHRLEKQGWVRDGVAPDRGQSARQVLQPHTGGQEAVDRRTCALEADGASHRSHHGDRAGKGGIMRWTRSNRNRELDEEIRAHIRMATQERVRNGEDGERARAEVIEGVRQCGSRHGRHAERLGRAVARATGLRPALRRANSGPNSELRGGGGTLAGHRNRRHHGAFQRAAACGLAASALSRPRKTGNRLDSGSAARKPADSGLLSGLAGLAPAGQRLHGSGSISESSRVHQGSRRVAASGIARSVGGFSAAAWCCARVGALLDGRGGHRAARRRSSAITCGSRPSAEHATSLAGASWSARHPTKSLA